MKHTPNVFLFFMIAAAVGCSSSKSTTSADMSSPDATALMTLAAEMGLADEVKSTFVSIVQKYDKKFLKVHNEPQTGDQEATLKKAMELRQAQNKELSSILDYDQMAQFSEWRQKSQNVKKKTKK